MIFRKSIATADNMYCPALFRHFYTITFMTESAATIKHTIAGKSTANDLNLCISNHLPIDTVVSPLGSPPLIIASNPSAFCPQINRCAAAKATPAIYQYLPTVTSPISLPVKKFAIPLARLIVKLPTTMFVPQGPQFLNHGGRSVLACAVYVGSIQQDRKAYSS